VSVAQDKDNTAYLTWKGLEEYIKWELEVFWDSDICMNFESCKYWIRRKFQNVSEQRNNR
jgi:hypothetical protein